MIKGILCGSFGCKPFILSERKVKIMDIFREHVSNAIRAYDGRDYAAALTHLNKAARILRQMDKIKQEGLQQTSQKT